MKKILFSNKDYNSNIRQGLQLSYYFSITVKVFVFFSCHVDCPVFNARYRLRTILKQKKRTLFCLILNIMEKKPRVWAFLWKSYIVEHAHNSILFLYLPSPLATFWPQLTAREIATSRSCPAIFSKRQKYRTYNLVLIKPYGNFRYFAGNEELDSTRKCKQSEIIQEYYSKNAVKDHLCTSQGLSAHS